jgi:predicted DNA-binding transcriptional regulator AlpA
MSRQESSVPLPRYLTVRQIAAMLRCCPQTVRNWVKRGLLPRPLALGQRKRLWEAEAVERRLAVLHQGGEGERKAG